MDFGLGNNFGKTSKEYGGSKVIWHYIGQAYPVGGTLSNIADFASGDIIPSGSMAILDTVNNTAKIVQVAAFDATKTYALNDEVIHGGIAYKCSTAITVAAAWNATEWTALAAGDSTYDDLVLVNGLSRYDIVIDDSTKSTTGNATVCVVFDGTIYSSRLIYDVPDVVWGNLHKITQYKEA